MNDDAEAASSPYGKDRAWIESLGLAEEEEKLIRHSLEMADAVMHKDTRAAGRFTSGEVERGGAARESGRAGRLVREGPSVPIEARREPYVQPSGGTRLVTRPEAEPARQAGEPDEPLDRTGSARTPHPPLPGPAT